MPLATKLNRPLTAQADDWYDNYHAEEPEASRRLSSESIRDSNDHHHHPEEDEDGEWSFEDDDEERIDDDNGSMGRDSDVEENAQQRLNDISFSTLARVHNSLHRDRSQKRKRAEHNSSSHVERLQGLQTPVYAKKNSRFSKLSSSALNEPPKPSQANKTSQRSEKNGDFSSPTGEVALEKPYRLSKHAPTIQSSKRPVSRHRTIIAASDHKSQAQDPRFSSLSGPIPDNIKFRHRYAFLNDYRQLEMDALRDVLGNGKKASRLQRKKNPAPIDDGTRDRLTKELGRMENRARAEADKERQERVMREWKRAERGKVEQGKKPFYLKNSERKKLALVDKFDHMKGKERERAMRKKRKKEGERDRRSIPATRRFIT